MSKAPALSPEQREACDYLAKFYWPDWLCKEHHWEYDTAYVGFRCSQCQGLLTVEFVMNYQDEKQRAESGE